MRTQDQNITHEKKRTGREERERERKKREGGAIMDNVTENCLLCLQAKTLVHPTL